MTWRKTLTCTCTLAVIAAIAGCVDNQSTTAVEVDGPELAAATMDEAAARITAMVETMNVSLAEAGEPYRVAMAEYVTDDAMGGTVIAKDVGNKQLSFDFVAGDERRAWGGSGTDVTYAIDQTDDAMPLLGGTSAQEATDAIDRAMATWSNQTCSDVTLVRSPSFGFDVGFVAFLNGLGGSPFIFADVQHAGFRDIDFAAGILGVAFTFGFTDANGFTDVNNDGRADAAFREIYYDAGRPWTNDGTGIDIETVAVHEAGHGLSRAHFGTVRIKNNGELKASPRAVMNALYSGPLRDLRGPDVGGHCSDWASWPNESGRK